MSNEDFGGNLNDYPNEKYKKFFDKFSEIKTLNISEWKPLHLISYFVQKYKDQYDVKYQFKFNSPSPVKSFEVFQIKKLAQLLSSNPQIIKEYIDWIFINVVPKAKRRLTSISFLTAESTVNDYKMRVLCVGKKDSGVDRSTSLPDQYAQVFNDCQVHAHTYGDVAFLSQMEPMPENIAVALDGIERLGFDMEILKRIA